MVVPIRDMELSIEPSAVSETGQLYLIGQWETFSWRVDGATDRVEALLLRNGQPLRTLTSGTIISGAFFKEGDEYEMRVSAMPKNGTVTGATPAVESLVFYRAPEVDDIGGIHIDVQPRIDDADDIVYLDRDAESFTVSWEIEAEEAEENGDEAAEVEVDNSEAELLEDGRIIATGLHSGDSLERALLKEDSTYVLRVSVVPKNGELSDVNPVRQSLTFQLYPKPKRVENLALEVFGGELVDGVYRLDSENAVLMWHYSGGGVERFELSATDPQGATVALETLEGTQIQHMLTLDKSGDYQVELKAIPRYFLSSDRGSDVIASVTCVVRPRVKSILEKYWYYIAAAALVAGGVAAALIVSGKQKKTGKKGGKRKRI